MVSTVEDWQLPEVKVASAAAINLLYWLVVVALFVRPSHHRQLPRKSCCNGGSCSLNPLFTPSLNEIRQQIQPQRADPIISFNGRTPWGSSTYYVRDFRGGVYKRP